MDNRLVVITNGNYFARIILNRLLNDFSDSVKGVLIITGDYKGRTGINSLWQLSKSTATPYILYKVISLITFQIYQRLYSDAIFSVEKLAKKNGIPTFEAISIKSDEALAWVSSLEPDLLVSVSCPQLIGKKMMATSKKGGINIHSSLLPTFAGLAPYHWVLSKGMKVTGTTVHYLTLKFDEGNILVQKKLPIEQNESAFQLFNRLSKAGEDAIVEGVELALAGSEGIKQDLSKFTYFSNPTFNSYLDLKRNGHVLIRLSELLKVIQEEIKNKDRTVPGTSLL